MAAQGRYILPAAAGVALLAAYTIDERGVLAAPFARSATRWLALAVLPAHLIGLAYTMIRYQHGLHHGVPAMNPLTGEWRPALGAATALVAVIAGLAALGAVIWLGTRNARCGDAEPAPERPAAAVLP
jgi:sterol desaturase/sphingolipid hydroxylase (fatty acid hydroxylase superfamily)